MPGRSASGGLPDWRIIAIGAVLVTCINGEPSQCQEFSAGAAWRDKNTIVDTSMKTLSGTWLSESCETRPGPEYVLRHYAFQEDGRYKLIQHHYWDSSCSSPKLTVINVGHLKTRRDSFLNHDALSGYIKPSNISIIPQDFRAIKELSSLLSLYCPGRYWKPWRRFEEHPVYISARANHKAPFYNLHLENHNYYDQNTLHHLHNISGDISCLGSLRWSFNELKLIKVQLRPNQNYNTTEMHWELLLGDIPFRSNLREHYSPTGFQVPLVKMSKIEKIGLKSQTYLVRYYCSICSKLLANGLVPPHLIKNPRLPPFISGEWVSLRCEVRPLGLYLTRQFSFYDNIWRGEHKFYEDPFCTFLKFEVTAAGSFAAAEPSEVLSEAFNIDFKIESATLTLFDRNMLHSIPTATCGGEAWSLGVPQELSLTHGCLQMGIVIPSVQYDIVKVEMNYQGLWLLFLGQADVENLPRTITGRPTAFQLPLVKCNDERGIADNNYFNVYNSGGFQKNTVCVLILFIIINIFNR